MNIEKQAVRAISWVTGAKLAAQVVSWVATLLVIRLLTPADYGLVATATMLASLIGTVAELGLGASIVQAASTSPDALRKLTALSWLIGAAAAACLVLVSPIVAWFFADTRLVAVTAAMSLHFAISGVAVVPQALAARDMAFRRLALVEIISALVSSLVTLAIAWRGLGVWALVAGPLLGAATRTVLIVALSTSTARPLFNFSGIRAYLYFGGTVLLNRIVYQLASQSDIAVGSRALSSVDVGHYAVALQLATLPMQKLMGIVNEVTLPTMSRLQHDLPRVHRRLIDGIALLALVAVPLMWGISAVASELVSVVLGPKWLSAIYAVTVISLVIPGRMIATPIFTTALGLGNMRGDVRNSVASAVIMPLGFLVGVVWGVDGLATSWLVSVPLLLSLTLGRTLRAIGVPPLEIWRAVRGPILSGLAMYLAVATVRGARLFDPGLPALAGLVGVGAVTYCGSALLLARRNVLAMRAFYGALIG